MASISIDHHSPYPKINFFTFAYLCDILKGIVSSCMIVKVEQIFNVQTFLGLILTGVECGTAVGRRLDWVWEGGVTNSSIHRQWIKS